MPVCLPYPPREAGCSIELELNYRFQAARLAILSANTSIISTDPQMELQGIEELS
jgi:hypothetical protein